jgi:hypothetical protein
MRKALTLFLCLVVGHASSLLRKYWYLAKQMRQQGRAAVWNVISLPRME